MPKIQTRRKSRIEIMIIIYQYLLTNTNLNELINNSQINIDEFILTIIKDIYNNKDKYINTINDRLNNYSFDRLGYIEQAILLSSLSEYHLKYNEKSIIIDEAIEISKIYCDDKASKLINGVLDNE